MSRPLGPDRKAAIGYAYRFLWTAADGYPSAAPTATFQFSAGNVAAALAAVRPADTVTAIGNDRRQITISTAGTQAASIIGLLGDYSGDAWLVGPGVSMPVRVMRLVSDTAGAAVLELADPLPHTVAVIATTSLRWLLYQGTIASGDVGAAVQRGVRWSIPWTRTQGAADTTSATLDQGLLHVVRTPFATGLTDQGLRAHVADLGRMISGGEAGWYAQREAGGVELCEWVRDVAPDGGYEDLVPGESLRAVHALLTVAQIFDGMAAEGKPNAAEIATDRRAKARERFDRIARKWTWYDADANGAVSPGELDVEQGVTAAGAVASLFIESSFNTNRRLPVFRRNQSH